MPGAPLPPFAGPELTGSEPPEPPVPGFTALAMGRPARLALSSLEVMDGAPDVAVKRSESVS